MKGSDPNRYWNYHAVCAVANGFCYSVTQSTVPVATFGEMATEGGPVIDHFGGWGWVDQNGEWHNCTQ